MRVDSLEFIYDDALGFTACKFDELSFFKKASSAFQTKCECLKCASSSCPEEACDDYLKCNKKKTFEGLKGVDVLLQNNNTLFLIEMKDYRKCSILPIDHIVSEVAKKFRDTLYVLWCGSQKDEEDDEKRLADSARRKKLGLSFVFHFESPEPAYASGLFSSRRGVIALSSVRDKLAKKLGYMSTHLYVIDMAAMRHSPDLLPWKVEEARP